LLDRSCELSGRCEVALYHVAASVIIGPEWISDDKQQEL